MFRQVHAVKATSILPDGFITGSRNVIEDRAAGFHYFRIRDRIAPAQFFKILRAEFFKSIGLHSVTIFSIGITRMSEAPVFLSFSMTSQNTSSGTTE